MGRAKPRFHSYTLLSSFVLLPHSRGSSCSLPELILLASPITLLFKRPTGLIEVCNLGRNASAKFACQPLISHPFPLEVEPQALIGGITKGCN